MKELVLTGNKLFWPIDEKEAIFLGEWCLESNYCYNTKDSRTLEILSPVWDSLDKISLGHNYLKDLFHRLVYGISGCLNKYYGVDFSERFWAIASYGVLFNWLETLYDRYSHLMKAQEYLKSGEKFKVKIPRYLPEFRLIDRIHWGGLVGTHDYNLYLFTQIIRCGKFSNFVLNECSVPFSFIDTQSRKYSLKNILKVNFLRLNIILSCSDFHYGNIYGSTLGNYLNYLNHSFVPSRFQLPQFGKRWGAIKPKKSINDFVNINFSFHAINEFENIVAQLILKSIPLYLLNGIPSSEPYERVKYWIGNDVYYGEKAFKVARVVENGGKWISAQHGGGYGTQPVISEAGEFYLSKHFISWGWKHKYQDGCQIYDLPFSRNIESNVRKNKYNILFITTTFLAYNFKLHSNLLMRDRRRYLIMQLEFLRNLTHNILRKVTLKPHNYGISIMNEIKEIISKDNIITNIPAKKLMAKCRLVVVDHFSTAILESLSLNIPTIAFWHKDDFPVVDEVLPDIKKLHQAKIYHPSPEEAAKFINEVYDNLDKWWQSYDVQKTRTEFCHKYARVSKSYTKDWKNFLKNLD